MKHFRLTFALGVLSVLGALVVCVMGAAEFAFSLLLAAVWGTVIAAAGEGIVYRTRNHPQVRLARTRAGLPPAE